MIFDRKTITGLIVGGLLGAASVFAPVVAQETHSPEHLKNVREVMKGLKVFNSFDQIIPTMAEQARALFVRNNPALAAEIEEATTNAALSLVERRGELDNEVVKIWADRFSEDQIRTIAEFFNSEAGQRFAAESGPLLQESAIAAKQWGDSLSVEIVDLVRKDLEDLIKPPQ